MTSEFLQPRKSQNVLNFCSHLLENQLRNKPYHIGTHTGKSLEKKLKDNVTRFSFVIYPI